MLDAGVPISLCSDWAATASFSTYRPLDLIEIAHSRQLSGRPEARMLEPETERLSLGARLEDQWWEWFSGPR